MTKVQQGLCAAISTYTKVKKATVTQVVEDYLKEEGCESPIITVALNQIDFEFTVGVSQHTIPLGEMMFFKYLEKSSLFADMINMLRDQVEAVAFYSGGALLVARIVPEYNGTGGIFVKRNKDSIVGYVIEPIQHYLADNHPIHREE
jgi:hypothetical protein